MHPLVRNIFLLVLVLALPTVSIVVLGILYAIIYKCVWKYRDIRDLPWLREQLNKELKKEQRLKKQLAGKEKEIGRKLRERAASSTKADNNKNNNQCRTEKH